MDKLEVILDNREHSLITEILSRDLDKYKEYIDIKKEQLDLADVQIKYKNIFYVFERKTPTDLISSIKDGRYKEQKIRLLSNVPISNITYIIEGDTVVSHNKYNANILHGSYLHTMFRDNIRIIYTKNISETASFIMILCGKLLDNPDKFLNPSRVAIDIDNNQGSYIDCLKLKQKKIANIDINTCYIMQLSQIPNISSVIAKNIAAIYPTYRELIYALDNIKDEENNKKRVILLTSIPKIGKEKALSILKFLSYI
uniref:ERCC4 domain-containing protein n=1 Tax=viral metagenome TaxID=1070528 RepID=A0A6C0J4Z5_9ZZZZ